MAERFMDPDDVRPVYLRIAEELRNDYTPGTQLPTVPTIADKWGVAKETVRSAIDVLRKEGLVISWQGRGTFYRVKVDEPTDVPDHPVVRQLLEQMMTRLDGFEARLTALEKSQEQ